MPIIPTTMSISIRVNPALNLFRVFICELSFLVPHYLGGNGCE